MNVLAVEFGESEEMIPVVGSPPWTPEEDKRLRKLALTGTSVAPMAKQMHRSMASVRNRAARLKIVLTKSHNQGLGLKAKGR
jgi:hypothetical protein